MVAINLKEPFTRPFYNLIWLIDSHEQENNISIFNDKIIVCQDQVKLHVKLITSFNVTFLPYAKPKPQ